MRGRSVRSIVGVLVLTACVAVASGPTEAAPAGVLATPVSDEAQLRDAFANDAEVSLEDDIVLTTTCTGGNEAVVRTADDPVTVHGNGHSITQTCDDDGVLENTGDGLLTIDDLVVHGAESALDASGDLMGTRVRVESRPFPGGTTTGVVGQRVTLVDSEISGLDGDIVFGVLAESFVSVAGTRVHDLRADDVYALFSFHDFSMVDSSVTGLTADGETFGAYAIGDGTVAGSSFERFHAGTQAFGAFVGGDVTVTDSVARDLTSDGDAAYAVVGYDSVTVVRSTIAAATGIDGAVGVYSTAAVSIVNSTITGVNGPGVYGRSASIVYSDIVDTGNADFAVEASGAATVDVPDVGSVTVPGVGVTDDDDVSPQVLAATLTVFASVITDARGVPNCDVESIMSKGYNFSDDTSCTLTATGDTQQAGADPRLGPLADNGGPTPTLLPETKSPLLEAIPAAACQTPPATGVTTDQRGEPRPGSTSCDIGAVEIQPVPVIEPTFTG